MVAGRRRVFPYLLGAFLLKGISSGFEGHGDAAGYMAGGAPGSGTPYYLLAMMFVIAAGACFIRAGYNLYRNAKAPKDEGKQAEAAKLAKVFADEPAPANPGFDADAALARYMNTRAASPGDAPAPASRPTFGRKQV